MNSPLQAAMEAENPNLKEKTPEPVDPVKQREKHFIDFKTKIAHKSKNEILRLCFDACEAINYLDNRVKELQAEEPVKEQPKVETKERKKWLGLKFR